MTYSFVLLTASCVVGQSPYNQVSTIEPSSAPTMQGRTYVEPAQASGLLVRLRELVRPSAPSSGYAVPQTAEPRIATGAHGVVQAGATMMTNADGSTGEPPLSADEQDVSFKVQLKPLQKKFREQAGYGEDFKWITGQLCRVHTFETSLWVVRYAALDQVDKYGGSVVLSTAVDMKNYREGDLVCVEGEVLKDRQAPGKLGGAVYRVTSISMITRGDAETK